MSHPSRSSVGGWSHPINRMGLPRGTQNFTNPQSSDIGGHAVLAYPTDMYCMVMRSRGGWSHPVYPLGASKGNTELHSSAEIRGNLKLNLPAAFRQKPVCFAEGKQAWPPGYEQQRCVELPALQTWCFPWEHGAISIRVQAEARLLCWKLVPSLVWQRGVEQSYCSWASWLWPLLRLSHLAPGYSGVQDLWISLWTRVLPPQKLWAPLCIVLRPEGMRRILLFLGLHRLLWEVWISWGLSLVHCFPMLGRFFYLHDDPRWAAAQLHSPLISVSFHSLDGSWHSFLDNWLEVQCLLTTLFPVCENGIH